MRNSGRQLSHRPRAAAVVLFSVVVALLMATPVGAWAAPSSAPSRTAAAAPVSDVFTASATWNGVPIQTANTTSSAFQIHFNGVVNILYTWASSLTGPAYSINDARLQIFYFGFALATRDIILTTAESSGNVVMNWSTGPLQYILEGSYQLTASLLATNSTTVWSQSFWVNVAAPFYILAILPIVLILIAIYELYAVATVGKQATIRGPKKGGGTGTSPSTPPNAPSTSTPPTSPSPEASSSPGTAGGDVPGSPPSGGAS